MENIEIEQPEYLDEIDTIILGNEELRERIYTLNKMNCESDRLWDFPVICSIIITLLSILGILFTIIDDIYGRLPHFFWIVGQIYWLIFEFPLILIQLPLLILNFIFDCGY